MCPAVHRLPKSGMMSGEAASRQPYARITNATHPAGGEQPFSMVLDGNDGVYPIVTHSLTQDAFGARDRTAEGGQGTRNSFL